jgi:putative addiction module CopG family antidote
MSYPFPRDLQTLVGEQMASGKYASEDELLRSALHALAEEEQDLHAVRESLDEWRAGDPGVLLEDAFDAIRGRHGLGEARSRTV